MSKSLVLPTLEDQQFATAAETAYQRLRLGIFVGLIKPGTALTIRGLAKTLQLSPTPAREVIRRLTAEGALLLLENRRVITPPMNSKRFRELIALRINLETHAALRAWPYINEAIIDEMQSVDIALDQVHAEANHEESVLLNHKFHRLLYQSNPHLNLLPLIESVWLQLGPFTRLANLQAGKFYVVDRHKEIIDSLRRRHQDDLIATVHADINDAVAHLSDQELIKILGS